LTLANDPSDPFYYFAIGNTLHMLLYAFSEQLILLSSYLWQNVVSFSAEAVLIDDSAAKKLPKL
jgi:hypothetical protein